MQIISSFHDLGLTSDDLVGDGVSSLRDLCMWRFSKVPAKSSMPAVVSQLCSKLTDGMQENDRQLVEGVLSRTDFSYLGGNAAREESACRSIVKTLHFLKFFDPTTTVKINDD